MIESLHFHRGYSLRLHKSKPFINYGIIRIAILFQELYRILRCFCRYLSAIADAMIKAELRASKIV
jgi:hypothetical protein